MAYGLGVGSFWDQTPATYRVAILGAIEARRSAYEQAMYGAWQTERFAREDKLKPFGRYVSSSTKTSKATARQTGAEMLAAFQNRAQAGAPIKIEMVDGPRRPGRSTT